MQDREPPLKVRLQVVVSGDALVGLSRRTHIEEYTPGIGFSDSAVGSWDSHLSGLHSYESGPQIVVERLVEDRPTYTAVPFWTNTS